MSSHEFSITASDGQQFGAYMAVPERGEGPGIIVIQEIFGVNYTMRSIANHLAQAGYVAVVPDLFWRLEPGLNLDDRVEADLQKAFALYERFDENKGVEDLQTTLNSVRNLPLCSGSVGTIGYCLGGKLAYLMATRSDAACNVSYYGVGIEKALDEASKISHPLMLHLAEKDKFVSSTAQEQIKEAFRSNFNVAIHSYPNVDHAFAREHGQHFDQAAAELANQRTRLFLKEYLRP